MRKQQVMELVSSHVEAHEKTSDSFPGRAVPQHEVPLHCYNSVSVDVSLCFGGSQGTCGGPNITRTQVSLVCWGFDSIKLGRKIHCISVYFRRNVQHMHMHTI